MFRGALNPRQCSLLRSNLLVLVSLAVAFPLSDFPHNRPTLLLVLPALLSVVGTADTIRCMRKRWSFYHGGVLLCIYMDLMAVALILVFLLYPYALWLSAAH
ncbi:MAG TPA: permease [Granulicella sp.]|nr:permease [Granulicella sp.]